LFALHGNCVLAKELAARLGNINGVNVSVGYLGLLVLPAVDGRLELRPGAIAGGLIIVSCRIWRLSRQLTIAGLQIYPAVRKMLIHRDDHQNCCSNRTVYSLAAHRTRIDLHLQSLSYLNLLQKCGLLINFISNLRDGIRRVVNDFPDSPRLHELSVAV
jgi:hypothetical protein